MCIIQLNLENVQRTCCFCYFLQIQTLCKRKISKIIAVFNPKKFSTSLVNKIKPLNCFIVEKSFMQRLYKVTDTVFPELLQLYWNDCINILGLSLLSQLRVGPEL